MYKIDSISSFLMWNLIIITVTLFFTFFKQKNNFQFSINGNPTAKKLTIGFILMGIILIGIYSFREIPTEYIKGSDAAYYKLSFINNTNDYFEEGYRYFSSFIRLFTDKYEIFLLINCTIMGICFIHLLKNYDSKYIFMPILLIVLIFMESLNIFRIILSVFLSFYLYKCLVEQKYIKSFLIALLCISFHRAAIILLPIILLNMYFEKKKINISKILYIILISIIIIFSASKLGAIFFEGTRYSEYFNGVKTIAYGNVGIILLTIIMSLKNFEKLVENQKINKIFIITICTSLIIIPMQINAYAFYRMYYFALPVCYLLMSNILEIYKEEKKIIPCILIILLFSYKYIHFFINFPL